MRTIKNLIIILTIIPCLTYGQDATLSQVNESPILLNPANTGTQYDLRAVLHYREQWRSISSPYQTMAASVDHKILRPGKISSSLGVGLSFLHDVAGEGSLATNQVNLDLSGKVYLTQDQSLSLGIYGGMVQHGISADKLTWGSQYNGLHYDESIMSGETFAHENYWNGDIGAGIKWQIDKKSSTLSSNNRVATQVGFAVFHLNTPETGFYEKDDEQNMRYVFHFNSYIEIKNTNLSFEPVGLFEKEGPAKQIYFGTYLKYNFQDASKYTGNLNTKVLGLGCFLRNSDAVIFAMKCELGEFAFGISYDVNISSLNKASSGRGAFELSVSYLGNSKKSKGNRLL